MRNLLVTTDTGVRRYGRLRRQHSSGGGLSCRAGVQLDSVPGTAVLRIISGADHVTLGKRSIVARCGKRIAAVTFPAVLRSPIVETATVPHARL